ncbi:MAG TPA: F0F1 ATP synthase subunit epsilon [Thermodesulfobacteriota bacterium]|nr:F0F1 ATP synthase subunit epsilon [Deltaproteobacteria bacterium]HNR12277.1 F0F1 ATP synthase subunit epsilon [Thermodesulfobacteriota bacterium]HNU70774.1 F0F1 ATP synthase subunit epsilon [Thermodesulfobacteriota bacterium]HOC38391.1 F0F1 ATP synthase subunit epsilon [Thermodesulfobacteriota bacterium]
MNLKVVLPTRVAVDQMVTKVNAEAVNGAFTLLPRHIDFVTALVPGLLSFDDDQGNEVFYAVDEGILVKCGQKVAVSTRRAVRGPDLGALRKTITQEFMALSEREKIFRSAAARIEASFARRFLEMHRYG